MFCEMTSSNLSQHHPTYCNISQQGGQTCASLCAQQYVARCRLEMFRPFGLTWCDLMVERCDRRLGVNTVSKYHTNRTCGKIFAFDSFNHLNRTILTKF